ncbi:MAG: arsenite S-adenosylmethyltransferase, partial [Actinomycetota bacterium]|nr:arsenite S-adenosylmethyltransferase [Actinomycetota bacterium]
MSKVETTERGVDGWVRARYGAFARGGGSDSGCCASTTSAGYATELGLYGADELAALPTAALALSRGCGNPVGFAELVRGETVVDLGCGGGVDVILAATQVGPTGR